MRGLVVTLLLAPLALSCELRQLYVNDNGVEMAFALDGRSRPAEPLVCVRSYAAATGTGATSDFVPLTGGRASIPAGDRTLVAHTFGSETVVLEDEATASGAKARTNGADAYRQEAWGAAARLSEAGADVLSLEVRNTPDHYFVGTARHHIPFRAEGDETYAVTLPLEDITRECTVRLTGIGGLDYVSSVEVFLSGCAGAVSLEGGAAAGVCVVGASAGRVTGTDDICASLRSFGRGAQEMTLYLLVTDMAGGRYGWSTPAGSLVEDGTAVFDASSLTVAEPTITGGGFRPTLTDWEEDVYDIYL